jgi:phytanoyl-CoA hydroxylase
MKYFNPDSTELKSYYDEQGYVTVRQVIPANVVDLLISGYSSEIVPSGNKFYRQNTNKYEKNQTNQFGHVQQSFLDIHDFGRHKKFSGLAQDIFWHQNMLSCLTKITGADDHNLMQTMLFDQNVATPPHQDWWYLDSVPAGRLLGAWIALEDIDERSGRFYLLPRTMHLHPLKNDPNISHADWLKGVAEYVSAKPEEIHTPQMQKGDVIFWNSRTIHGSHHTIDEHFSRKSLTAHYLPSDAAFGNIFKDKSYIKYEEINGRKYFKNQPDYSVFNSFKFFLKTAIYNRPLLLRALRKFQ